MLRPSIPYIAPIDGLRAVAVLSVIIYHLNARFLPGGFIGVDIFFVISGFVVSGALPANGVSKIGPLLALFYSRRATRILPALYVCLFSTTLLSMLFVPNSWLSEINEYTGRAAVWGYSNFVLASGAGDYFRPRAEYNLFTHTWSLGVEEQFYALFPWLFLPWLAGKRAWSITLFVIASLLSLTQAFFAATSDPVSEFYLITSRFWELAAGVLAYQLSSRPLNPNRPPVSKLLSAACAIQIAMALVFTEPNHTPYPGSLMPCGATAILLVALRSGAEARFIRFALSSPPMVYLGRISYSLYLWHWPIFALFRWTVGLAGFAHGASATAIALAASILSHRFVEAPPRRFWRTGA